MINGKILNELRTKKELSVDDVANKLNVSTSTVYRWEREDSLKDRKTIESYAELLGVSAAYLLTAERCEVAVTVEEVDTEADTEADTTPAAPVITNKKPLSLVKVGLITAASTFGLLVIITSIIIICNYFRPPVSNGAVTFWIYTTEEIFVVIALAILFVTAVTFIAVLTVFIVRKKRNNVK